MEGPGAPGVASSPRHWAHGTAGHTAAFAHLGKKQRLAEDNLEPGRIVKREGNSPRQSGCAEPALIQRRGGSDGGW